MTRAICVFRVSTYRQEYSLDAQRKRAIDYCRYEQFELDESDIFFDEATSGKKEFGKRTGSSAALAALADHGDVLVIPKLDRGFRNAPDAMLTIRKILKDGKNVHLMDFRVDARSTNGKMFIGLLSVLAEWEADTISDRTREVLAEVRHQGKKIGRAPFGMRNAVSVAPDGSRVDAGRHVVHRDELPVLRRIFDLRDSHPDASQRDLARMLNAERVQTRTGREWSHRVVGKILARRGEYEGVL